MGWLVPHTHGLVGFGHHTKSNLQTRHNPDHNSKATLHRNWKIILNFSWEHKRGRIAKIILNNNQTLQVIIISDLKVYYRAEAIKIKGHWYNNRHMDRGIEVRADIQAQTHTVIWFLDRGYKTHWKKKAASSTIGAAQIIYLYV